MSVLYFLSHDFKAKTFQNILAADLFPVLVSSGSKEKSRACVCEQEIIEKNRLEHTGEMERLQREQALQLEVQCVLICACVMFRTLLKSYLEKKKKWESLDLHRE